MKLLLLTFLLVCPLFSRAETMVDTLKTPEQNTTMRDVRRDTTINRREKMRQYSNIFVRVIKAFDDIDTSYIERAKYNWQFHMKSTYSEDWFSLTNLNTDQRAMFKSQSGIKIGPNLGWRWLGLGYNFDVGSLGNGHKYSKTEFNFSVYSTMIGFDAFYRRTGSDYRLHNLTGFNNLDKADYIGRENNGIQVAMTGLNAYYIINRHKFCLGSAYANSMKEQKRSVGSGKLGLCITKHDINFNKDTLMHELGMVYNKGNQYVHKMHYWDFSISGGYTYNWVFTRHWLFNIDVQPAIGYKRTSSEIWKAYSDDASNGEGGFRHNFYQAFMERGNININLIARAALVWNNGHYFGGMTFVMYNFNYRHQNMTAHNTFFTLKGYLGLNFMEKKSYKEKKRRLAQHNQRQH